MEKELIKGFEENNKNFEILAAKFIADVHKKLDCCLQESSPSIGGRKVLFEKGPSGILYDKFVSLEVFANGQVSFEYVSRNSGKVILFFYLQKDDNGKLLKEAIRKAKKHLI
ncbi:MAG: hypothetical protein WCO35_00640 [Candidatus Nomurabacteria bacterium]